MELLYQILLVLGLVFLNGFFVASEFALVSVRKTRIDELVKRGGKSAKLVQDSLKDLDTYISGTQLGITLASLALGWVGEPALGHYFESVFEGFVPQNFLSITSNGVAIALAFTLITFLHIVLGELVPKTVALQKSELVSLYIISPLIFFTNTFKPFIWILNGAGDLVLKVVGFKAPTGHALVHSEEEIKMILAQSAEEGAIEKKEAEMVYSVLRFGDIPVNSIMIPRVKVIAFDVDTPIDKVIKKVQKRLHSRFPVFKDSIDYIHGFVHIKDLYTSLYKNKSASGKDLTELKIVRDIPHVPESARIDDVLLIMQNKRVHLAVVDDDGGGTAGIVTMEDVVEKLTGEIHDEFESFEKKVGSK